MKKLMVMMLLLVGASCCLVWAQTPGEIMKKGGRDALKGKIMTAQINAMEKEEAALNKEFDNEAKKGILTNVVPYTASWADSDWKVNDTARVKYKLLKDDKYYYYAEKGNGSAGEAKKGYDKVSKRQEVRAEAQKIVQNLGKNNRYIADAVKTPTHVTLAKNAKGKDAIRVVYYVRGDYLYEDIELSKISVPQTALMVELKKIAKKGLESLGPGKKPQEQKGSVKELQEMYEKKLGRLTGVKDMGDGAAVLTWEWGYKAVSPIHMHVLTIAAGLTKQDMEELKVWAKESDRIAEEKWSAAEIIGDACPEVEDRAPGYTFTEVKRGSAENKYILVCVKGKEKEITQTDPEVVTYLRDIAMSTRMALEKKEVSCEAYRKVLGAFEKRYKELLNDLYIKEKFVKTYNPVHLSARAVVFGDQEATDRCK